MPSLVDGCANFWGKTRKIVWDGLTKNQAVATYTTPRVLAWTMQSALAATDSENPIAWSAATAVAT